MSATIWFAMTLMVFGDGDVQKASNIIPEGLMTYQECVAWKKRADDRPKTGLDLATGRPVLFTRFDCIPVGLESVETDIATFKASPDAQE